MRPKHSGFTLIELLVVIAIIGILSAVVIAALSTARSNGNDAGIVSDIETVSTQAVVYSLSAANPNYGTYGTAGAGATCPTPGTSGTGLAYDPVIEKAMASALSDSGNGHTYCAANGTTWAVAVSRPPQVQNSKSYFWCTDSSGAKCGNDGNGGDGATPIVGGLCVACTVNN